jgi:hypothetical protein
MITRELMLFKIITAYKQHFPTLTTSYLQGRMIVTVVPGPGVLVMDSGAAV